MTFIIIIIKWKNHGALHANEAWIKAHPFKFVLYSKVLRLMEPEQIVWLTIDEEQKELILIR